MANEIKAIKIDNTTYDIDYSPSTQYCLPLGGGTINGNLTVNGQLNTGNINGYTPITSGNIVSQSVNYADSAGSVAWGNVSDKPVFATVATSGSYADLTDKPTIPTNTNQLTNGAEFITAASIPSSLPANGGTSTYANRLGDSTSYYTKADIDSALNGKQGTISDLATIRSQASNGNTAYGWGNHASAGYANGTETVNSLNFLAGCVTTLDNDKQETLVSGTNIKTINGDSILGSGDITIEGGAQAMVSTTWAELKELRDNASLVSGTWYRITDYVTTTSQSGTRSLGNPFDVVVLATGENTLSEEARAIRHEGDISMSVSLLDMKFFYKGVLIVDGVEWFEFESQDGSLVTSSATPAIGDIVYPYLNGIIVTDEAYSIESVSESENEYFLNNKANLDAWKIWYCLDNDKKRFPWAYAKMNKQIVITLDSTTYAEYNGTYYYENILYHRWDVIDNSISYTVSCLTTSDNPSIGDIIPFYGIISAGFIKECTFSIDAVIEPSTSEGFGVIYRMIDERGNDCPYDFKNIQFLIPILDGQFDDENGIEEWVFTFNLNYGDGYASMDYSNNSFYSSFCSNNLIKSSLLGLNFNIFLTRYNESPCHNNTLETNCSYNIFNDSCHNNTLETNCSYNTFEARISNCKVAFGIQAETIPYSSIFNENNEVHVSYDYNNNKLLIGTIQSYIDSNCNIPVITTTKSVQSLVANTYYKWLNTPTNITITLISPSNSNILNNYMFEFTTSSSGCTLSVPSSIKWSNEIPPNIESNKTYQISIINNLATIAKFG